jgi:ribosomal protein S18 acetylase RimI-like enzyme
MKITIYNSNDRDVIFELIKELDNSFTPPLSQRVDLELFFEKISKNALGIIAWNNTEEPIETLFVYCNDKEKNYAYIPYLAVNKTYQGKGIGKALLGYMENELKKRNIISVGLHSNNPIAIHLYKKSSYVIKDNSLNPRVYMEKAL